MEKSSSLSTTDDPGRVLSQTITYNFQEIILPQVKEKGAFFIVNLSRIIEQYELWKREFPGITPHYAVKCNPNPAIIQLLAHIGCHFDCASAGEIQLVLDNGGSRDKIIYANPIKGVDHLLYAREKGIKRMTFDSQEELEKIHMYYPEAECILRLAVDDSQSICKFNTKFGADIANMPSLLEYGKELGVNIIGASFHVGSGCQSAEVYRDAIMKSKETLKKGKELGHDMTIIDIGGGYPGTRNAILFEDVARVIREAKNECDNEIKSIEWIGEPGRFMVASSSTLVTEVIGVKKEAHLTRYYLNEGVYASLSGVMFDYQKPVFSLIRKDNTDTTKYPSIFFGPTCDSLDKVGEFELESMNLGDQVVFHEIGDYSSASASTFNGFKKAENYYYVSNEDHKKYTSYLGLSLI